MRDQGKFMVVFSNPEKAMITCTIHSYSDSQGEVYASRSLTLGDEGLIVYDDKDTYRDMLMPSKEIESQVKGLISQFAEENGVSPEEVHYSGMSGGKPKQSDSLELPSTWKDPTLIRKIQKTWQAKRSGNA